MPAHTHPADPLVAELVGLYEANAQRLEGIVQSGLRRGLNPARLGQPDQQRGDATLAYRRRQREQALAIIDGLRRQAAQAGPLIVGRAYGSGVVTIDKLVERTAAARAGVLGQFGRVHVRAVEALAGNMSAALERAAVAARTNVELVFARADLLDGPLPAGGRVGGVPFLGRRANDPYRALALEEVAGGIIGLDTRRQVSAGLARRLVREGVTDALTGFVDRAGRRWSLPSYAAMVARTTTREAMSTATGNRMGEHGLDLVTISTHAHPADECTPFEGNTYSLTGATAGVELLGIQPPFHPNCVHVMYPAGANLDAFEAELERNAYQPPDRIELNTATPPPPAPPVTPEEASRLAERQAARPFPSSTPNLTPSAPARRELERQAYGVTAPPSDLELGELLDGDPGREAGADAAWAAWAAKEDKAANRALNAALGPDLAKFIDRAAGKRAGIRRRLLHGEISIEDAEQEAYEIYAEAEAKRILREENAQRDYGLERRSLPCFTCGQLKRRPSDVCAHCGDDPVQPSTNASEADNADRQKFDRAYGYGGNY